MPWSRVERFVGLFTHDLRNGLNALELQLTLLGEISDDPVAKAEVKRMRGTVAEVTRQLQAVRLSTGAPTPHLFAYPAADFLEDLRERFDRQHPDALARVQWEVAVGAGSLVIDPELTMAALLELLGNALLYAVGKSTVQVHATAGPDGLTLTIREQSALAPSDSPEEWGRSPLSSSRRDGYGLGAFRAWRIIALQNGTLRFAHSEADQCLVTTVVMPLDPAGAAD